MLQSLYLINPLLLPHHLTYTAAKVSSTPSRILKMTEQAANGSPLHLPIVDISFPTPESCKELLAAAAEWGFLYVRFTKGAGMESADVGRLFDIVSSTSTRVLNEEDNRREKIATIIQ